MVAVHTANETNRIKGIPFGIQTPIGARYLKVQSVITRINTPKVIPQIHAKEINTITDLLVNKFWYLSGLTILKYRFIPIKVSISTLIRESEHDRWAVNPRGIPAEDFW